MDPEIEIKITTRSGTVSSVGRESGAPAPDPEEGRAGGLAARSGVPSPEIGGAVAASGEVPTPMSAGESSDISASAGLPEPVELDRIGQLGSPDAGADVPEPEDE